MSEAMHATLGSELVAWHAVPANEVVGRLHTDPATGLDAAEASRRLSQYGPNRLPEGKQRGPLMRFVAQLNSVLVYVLLGAGFVKLVDFRHAFVNLMRVAGGHRLHGDGSVSADEDVSDLDLAGFATWRHAGLR